MTITIQISDEIQFKEIMSAVEDVRSFGFEISAERKLAIVFQEAVATGKDLVDITAEDPMAFYALGMACAKYFKKIYGEKN